ncbi:uncharacterized protein Dana_GF26962 [Drosophila ananassae]|uniref:Nose resistant-to-fluoxetine protein N-terminal domain-containing protein n=1 Tax=Drosophila ananassae TaxID=7217 RepID=A0A0P8Y1D4_DROAN|nr:nose resistant to fluoxetine protein 6 [Drosophila ananassae]KPU80570.1 uncharacterized protein Dana_GF26962 [Drosophila ananassae]
MVDSVQVLLLFGLIAVSQSRGPDVPQDFEIVENLKPLGVQFVDYLQNEILPGWNKTEPREDDLDECSTDLTAWRKGISSRQTWARKMIDSWGSIPSGIFTGDSYDLGNFDECLSIEKLVEENRKISGKYCFLTISSLKIATCFPASCSATKMQTIMEKFLQTLLNSGMTIKINESGCQTSEKDPWDGLTIFTIVLLSVLSTFVIIATLYDYFLCKDQSQLPVIVKSFSARANSRALFKVESSSNPNVIQCLNGIRCTSLIWVIFCHEYAFSMISPNLNTLDLIAWVPKLFSSFMVHGYFSVDSFFVLGGMLVSMIVLRTMEKSNGKLNPLMMYLHRIIRILPVVAVAILIYMTMMPVVSGGPMFKGGYHGKHACEKNWFWTLLFVQNYAVVNYCINHSWYLAVDMQLYFISPFLLIAIYKWGKKAAAGIVVLIVLLSGCLFATQMVNKYSILFKNGGDSTKELYYATHTHAAPWLIGFLFGYFLHLNRGKKFELNKLTVWSGWILCLAMLFTSIFALYPAGKYDSPPISILAESFYYTLTRVGWPLAICWIVFACMQGYGGLANSFLSSPLWQPFTRLSYSMFIWHMFVQEVNIRNTRTNTYFSNYQVMLHFWEDFGFILLMSYFLYLIVEAPLGFFDVLLRKRRVPAVRTEPKLSPEHLETNQTNQPENQNHTDTNVVK